jgi:hypothetical protein
MIEVQRMETKGNSSVVDLHRYNIRGTFDVVRFCVKH